MRLPPVSSRKIMVMGAYPSSASKSSRVVIVNSSASWQTYFQDSKSTGRLMVVDFTATWCGPCRLMEPALNEFADKYTDVDFYKIDVDQLFAVAQEFEVEAMPTFLLIKKGAEVDKIVGAKKEELQRKIEAHRKK